MCRSAAGGPGCLLRYHTRLMTLSEKKSLVARFIERCNAYADAELARYRAELETQTGWSALATQDKIAHWTAYRAFNEYTLAELQTDELDHWFTDSDETR